MVWTILFRKCGSDEMFWINASFWTKPQKQCQLFPIMQTDWQFKNINFWYFLLWIHCDSHSLFPVHSNYGDKSVERCRFTDFTDYHSKWKSNLVKGKIGVHWLRKSGNPQQIVNKLSDNDNLNNKMKQNISTNCCWLCQSCSSTIS